MTRHELYDLQFLIRALRVEAHSVKKRSPNYGNLLLGKLDRIQPIVEKLIEN